MLKNVLVRVGLAAAVIGLTVGWAAQSKADVLTFDDISANAGGTLLSTYGGFTWTNFYVLNAVEYGGDYGTNGYTNGMVSAPNVAYNGYGDPASLLVSSSTPFTFNSVYLNAAWNNGLSITITGYGAGNTQLDQTTVVVNATGPATLFTFNWTGIESLNFTSFGGTSAGYSGAGTHFAMDNFTFNATSIPEPSTFAFTSMAVVLGLGYGWRRRKANLAA